MQAGPLFGFLVLIVALGAFFWFLVRAVRKGRQQMGLTSDASAELGKLLGPTVTTGLYAPAEVVIGDHRVTVRMFPGGKNSPPTLRITLPIDVRTVGAKSEHGVYRDTARRRVSGELGVLFRKETSTDRFGKRIGLNVEHDTGDKAFDDEVYIESDASRDDLEALLGDTGTRQAVHQILGLGYTNVELFRGESVVQVSIPRPSAKHVQDTPQVVERLAIIANNLPAFDGSPVGRAVPMRNAIVSVVGMVGGFAAFVFGALSANHWEVVTAGAVFRCGLIGIGGWVVACALAFFSFRGKSDALRTFSFVFFCGLFGLPALAIGIGTSLNGALDTGAATAHDARIIRRYSTTSKNNTTYHLELESWRPDRKSIEVVVSPPLYGKSVEGHPLRVHTRPGWLGWEWVDKSQPYALVVNP